MLVSAASWVSIKMSLFLWMFSRIPYKSSKRIRYDYNNSTLNDLRRNQFASSYLFIPRSHDVLHVHVTCEECHNSVRDNGGHFQQQVSIVPDHSYWMYKQNGYLSTALQNTVNFKHKIYKTAYQNLLWSQTWRSSLPDHSLGQRSEKDGKTKLSRKNS